MLKKISWIVALFAALTIVFMGCTNLGVDPDAEVEDVERIDLGAPGFNTVAGNPSQQKGWATDGYTDVDNPEEAADGYKLADFKKAKYLVIETAQNAKGGLQFVWQSANYPDNGWKLQKFDALASSSGANPGVTKEANKLGGQTIKIDIKKVMGSTYANFLEASGNVRFIIAYYSSNLADLDVKEAYLLVSAEAQEAGTELPGLGDGLGQLGQTTVRKSGTEYGWQFAVRDSEGKLPKGFKDVAELRPDASEPVYLLLVTEGGGIGINSGVGGFHELSITFEASGKFANDGSKGGKASRTTSLYGEYFHLTFNQGGQVVFVIDLKQVPGYTTIVAEQKFSSAEVTNDKTGNIKLNDIKYQVVNLILQTKFPEFGMTRAYVYKDTAGTLAKSAIPSAFHAEDLEGSFLAQPVGPFGGSYVTDYDVTLPMFYDGATLDLWNDKTGTTAFTEPTGNWQERWIATPADITAIQGAPNGSFLRVYLKNVSGGDRSGWGCVNVKWNASETNEVALPIQNGIAAATGFRDISIETLKTGFASIWSTFDHVYLQGGNDVWVTGGTVDLYTPKP
jgi:hypothetical protein